MSERSELRRRREERMENGVKNLKGARLFPKTFSNHGFGDASMGRMGYDVSNPEVPDSVLPHRLQAGYK